MKVQKEEKVVEAQGGGTLEIGVSVVATECPKLYRKLTEFGWTGRMAKDLKTKERFIELRAEGLSFIRISKELKVSKPTLIRWQTELERQVSAAKFARHEMLIEQYSLMRQHRISHFGELLSRILDELRKRDLTEVPTDKLIGMALNVDTKLKAEIASIVHEEPPEMDFPDPTLPKRIHID